MKIVALGDSALLVRLGDATGAPGESIDAVAAAVRRIDALTLPPIVEIVPAYASIGVFYDSARMSSGYTRSGAFESLKARIELALAAPQPLPNVASTNRRVVEIPVCYDAEFALDLDLVAGQSGLTPAEVVARHSGAEYRVSCIGFAPGFPYLSGLPQALATPRRATPRKEVPAGSVAIGGAQTGIYPQPSPGGWNVIGRTPLRMFDVRREPPALLAPADVVHFRAITREQFATFSE